MRILTVRVSILPRKWGAEARRDVDAAFCVAEILKVCPDRMTGVMIDVCVKQCKYKVAFLYCSLYLCLLENFIL